MRKVIVLGLDGFEPSIVESMLEAGELPHLAQLRAAGSYRRLQTTYPALTPAAWSTFATGTNPGGHGVFDFVRRDPASHLPTLALNRYEQKNPFLPPKAVNLRRGVPLWQVLTEAGVPSVILRCPCTYPPDNIYGRMLAGVGVPDLRGGLGTSTYYSSGATGEAQEQEQIVSVQPDQKGVIRTHLIGPRNPKTRSDFLSELEVHPDAPARRVTLRTDGQPGTIELREGEWSDWIRIRFKAGLLQSIHGIVRFHLVRVAPALELYASPINFDPTAPMFPISSPPEYAKQLAAKLGTFYTVGMAEDDTGLVNGRLSETAFLDQIAIVLRERTAMMRYELERLEQGLFFCLFDTPDRLQHVFWRYRKNGRAAADPDAPPDAARLIEEHYRACDAVIGQAMEMADDETLLVVLSDHGMNGFERGVNINTWLYEQGLLALKDDMEPGAEAGDFFRHVDWSRTRAYAVGLGGIYLNLAGREEGGVVSPEEADDVKSAISRSLAGLADPERGGVAVRRVVEREAVYSGPYVDEAPDLLVNFSAGYRASWGTPLGAVPATVFEDNGKKWAGDHAIDPTLVPGVLFTSRTVAAESPSLVDLAPTILSALGVPAPASMEGQSILA